MTAKASRAKSIMNIISFMLQLFLNIIFYIIVIMITIHLCTQAEAFTYQIFGNEVVEAAPGRDVTIEIKSGDSTFDVSRKLEINRIIVNKYSFYVKAKLTKQVIMPGKYILNTSMNYDEIFRVITDLSASTEKESAE